MAEKWKPSIKKQREKKQMSWNKYTKWNEIEFQSDLWREIKDELEALDKGLWKKDRGYLK